MIGICGFYCQSNIQDSRDIARRFAGPFCTTDGNRAYESGDSHQFFLFQSNNNVGKSTVGHKRYSVEALIFGDAFLHDAYSRDGESFLTKEALERLYIQMGMECLSVIDGYWAIAITDYDQKKIMIARDRKGFKPIYYSICNNAFYFSTSIKSFENSFPLSIDYDSVKMFLHYLYIPSPKTIYKDVHAVRPGECVIYSLEKGLVKKKYTEEILGYPWQREPENHPVDQRECVNQFEGLIVHSVSRHIQASKKTAVLLSGGKDSSTLAIAAKLSGHDNVEALTVGFDDAEIDEGGPAGEVARHIGLNHRIIFFTENDYLDSVVPVVNSLEQPMGDSAAFPVYLAISKTCDEFDVYLDGTGSDTHFIIPATGVEKLSWYIKKNIPWSLSSGKDGQGTK
ncbi:MAG: asparagine synthase-related protein [Planctomycetota bacterium]|jgi:asparagine synthase (glutamine-hydrolysing)